MVFMLRHSHHAGGRKQKISPYLLLFIHQQYLYIAAVLSVSLEIGCKLPIHVVGKFFSHAIKNRGKGWGQEVANWVTKVKFLNISRFKILWAWYFCLCYALCWSFYMALVHDKCIASLHVVLIFAQKWFPVIVSAQ